MPTPRARSAVAGLLAALALTVALPVASAAASAPVVTGSVPTAKAPKSVVLRLTYKVVPGDSFARIARRHGVPLAALLRTNKARPTTVLRVGRVLSIPAISIPGSLAAKLPRSLLQRPERLRLVPVFQAAAREFGVPVDLLMAVAWRESNWNQSARSRSGAMGIGQLMPDTVTYVSSRLLRLRSPLDPWEPSDNIRMSARTLRHLSDLTRGDPVRLLAAYYQGFGSVTRLGVLPIGQRYADSILALRPTFRA
jgi:soluble lytic murein transglycosylase-like protein